MRALLVFAAACLVACGPKGDAASKGKAEGPPSEEGAAPDPAPAQVLGASAAPECTAAMAELEALTALQGSTGRPDAAAARKHWEALEPWVAALDEGLGRVPRRSLGIDVALAGQSLEQLANAPDDDSARRALLGVVTQVRLVAFLETRRLLTAASDADPDKAREPALLGQQWDTAWCLWEGAVRPLAKTVDASPTRGGEDWEPTIVAAFEQGRAAITGASHEPTITMVQRQIIEKGSYALVHRLVLDRIEAVDDPTGPFEAAALLGLVEDRIADRNGPGLARIRKAAYGPPRDIEIAAIERDMAVAFIKRARKYCDEAVTGGGLGTAEAIKGAWEGRIYSQVVLTTMATSLGDAGFDADAYLADWDDYIKAVTDSDSDSAAAISTRLVKWNCAYQDRLEIAACTATANEDF